MKSWSTPKSTPIVHKSQLCEVSACRLFKGSENSENSPAANLPGFVDVAQFRLAGAVFWNVYIYKKVVVTVVTSSETPAQ